MSSHVSTEEDFSYCWHKQARNRKLFKKLWAFSIWKLSYFVFFKTLLADELILEIYDKDCALFNKYKKMNN